MGKNETAEGDGGTCLVCGFPGPGSVAAHLDLLELAREALFWPLILALLIIMEFHTSPIRRVSSISK